MTSPTVPDRSKQEIGMAGTKVAVVAGVGPGNGVALARRFAAGGYRLALLARDGAKMEDVASGIDGAQGYACDVTDRASVDHIFTRIRDKIGEIDTLLFNAGSGVFKGVEEITPDEFERAWRVNAYGALLCSQAVIPSMKRRGFGAIIFTGATASLRGGKTTAAFAPAKAAQRSLAQSMARSLGPNGIHVGLIIVDGVVDTPATRGAMPDKPDDFFIDPMGVAETAWQLAHQDPSAWTFELDVRPFGESW
jgi:NAD(P)-dependent dehydrogenase (short-subunit alcohol dehydrogenase family)